jgi:hypothetical protein
MASTFSTDLALELVATGEKLVYGVQLLILTYKFYNNQHQV